MAKISNSEKKRLARVASRERRHKRLRRLFFTRSHVPIKRWTKDLNSDVSKMLAHPSLGEWSFLEIAKRLRAKDPYLFSCRCKWVFFEKRFFDVRAHCVDFAFPRLNVCVEVMGPKRPDRFADRSHAHAVARRNGVAIIRFPESLIRRKPLYVALALLKKAAIVNKGRQAARGIWYHLHRLANKLS